MSYDQHTAESTTLSAGVGVMMFPADSRRVTLTISSDEATSNVSLGTGPSYETIYMRLTAPITIVLPYRDFGPLIKQEVWIFGGLAGKVWRGLSVILIKN